MQSKLFKYVTGLALSASLVGTFSLANPQSVKADSTVGCITVKRNSYIYNSKGKRANRSVYRKGDSAYSEGSKIIRGHKYYRLRTNRYIKARNVFYIRATRKAKLIHNAYMYNRRGRRLHYRLLKKGNWYWLFGSRMILRHKYYRLGSDTYIKAGNVDPAHKKTGARKSNKHNNKDTASMTTGSAVFNGDSNSTGSSKSGHIKWDTEIPTTSSDVENGDDNNQPDYSLNHIKIPDGYTLHVLNTFGYGNNSKERLIASGMDINQFHSESARDDNTKVNPDHLTPSEQRELSKYALRLLNEARAQMGSSQWTYNSHIQTLANSVADEYRKDNAGLSHDVPAIERAFAENGIQIYGNECEDLEGSDYSNYAPYTMTSLKHAIYKDMVDMMFGAGNDTTVIELFHAQDLLTDEHGHNQFAVSFNTSYTDGEHMINVHFISWQ